MRLKLFFAVNPMPRAPRNTLHWHRRPIKPPFKMLNDFLHDRAALYASGEMTAGEREQFELLLEFHEELLGFVAGLNEASAAMMLAAAGRSPSSPSPELKARISSLIGSRPQQRAHEALVVSDPDGFVQWVNPAFTSMCGYSLEELRGKKLGPVLQGTQTDRATAGRIREAVHGSRPCRETILNYHKNGAPYWVEIAITPVVDERGATLWFLARERELSAPLAA
jgi:PAS domain S-box-containing protein